MGPSKRVIWAHVGSRPKPSHSSAGRNGQMRLPHTKKPISTGSQPSVGLAFVVARGSFCNRDFRKEGVHFWVCLYLGGMGSML